VNFQKPVYVSYMTVLVAATVSFLFVVLNLVISLCFITAIFSRAVFTRDIIFICVYIFFSKIIENS